MYFLNGDRLYIKPGKACGTLEEQLSDCLSRLKLINSGKKIFKLNFFVDAGSDEIYERLQKDVNAKVAHYFSSEIVVTLLAQPPLTCKIIAEAFYYDPKRWRKRPIKGGHGSAVLFQSENTEVLIGSIQSNQNKDCKTDSEISFYALSKLFQKIGFPVKSIVRQWNYIENIVGFDGEEQRYQEFNNVRSFFYANHFEKNGYPAATGIGMNRGGVIVEFVAVKSDVAKTLPIDNPVQIAAHDYSSGVLIGEECLLKTTPKFERARYFELFDRKLIFISGTASIKGENTVGVEDPVEQTKVTIQNIQQLYTDEIIQDLSSNSLKPKYGHARVYLKNRKDFAAVKKTFKSYFGNLPVVYIVADICRKDLLVEIEGKVILE